MDLSLETALAAHRFGLHTATAMGNCLIEQGIDSDAITLPEPFSSTVQCS